MYSKALSNPSGSDLLHPPICQMDPNTYLAGQLKRMGFDLEEMESTTFRSENGYLFEGSYIDIIPCEGLLKQYGDFLELHFHVTHPIDLQASLSGITVSLLENDIPFPVVSHRYERGWCPVKGQIIEQMYQVAKAAAVSKKFDHKEPPDENKIKNSQRP